MVARHSCRTFWWQPLTKPHQPAKRALCSMPSVVLSAWSERCSISSIVKPREGAVFDDPSPVFLLESAL